MVATLDSDGDYIQPYYLISQYANAPKDSGRRPEHGDKPIKGMTESIMKEYADFIEAYTNEPTMLVWDRHSAHTSNKVIDYFEAKKCSDGCQKFKIKLLPPKSAFLISPLDFGFFGYWKSKYYALDRSTPELKIKAANQVWQMVEAEKIKQFFRSCFLIGKLNKNTLHSNLMKRVRGGIPEKLQEVWDYYDGWKSGSYEVDGVSAPREIPLEPPQQLDSCKLTGVYWTNWGRHGMKC